MFIVGRSFQALGLIVSAMGLFYGVLQDDLGTEMVLFGVGLALFMLGLLFAKKAAK